MAAVRTLQLSVEKFATFCLSNFLNLHSVMHSAELCSTDHLLELCPRMADTTMALHGRPISCPAFQSTLSPVMNISRSGIVGYKQVKYAGQEVGIF